MSRPNPSHAPPLIADRASLIAWLQAAPNGGSPWGHDGESVALEAWLALGEDASEAHYRRARDLGVPLVRLSGLEPSPEATALIRPEVARRLRAVPSGRASRSYTTRYRSPGRMSCVKSNLKA